MRTYVGTTGVIFALVTVAHLLRTGEVVTHLRDDPWFVAGYTALTVLCAALALWAWRVLRRLPAGGEVGGA